MITEKEQQATLLSATKKDYYQIWNELLETAGKISERWDPTTTNESDPGIVLLKLLTGIADKLAYNIDKNILEAFMPSAAQEESMRKLCEMMGYSMKYYNSATTDVTIYYAGDSEDWQSTTVTNGTLILPAFTQITNVDQDVVYTTTSQVTFTQELSTQTVPCIEGTLNTCEEDNEGVVTIDNIDDNNRYYLPSPQVAENGIFIYNISDGTLGEEWTQVNNLNTQELESRVYKFGYDSQEFLPYIEFPSDISSLIEDGLSIAYIVTNGLNGNVSAKTLTTFTAPDEWGETDSSTYNTTGVEHTSDEFSCYNASAATNGTDKESLNDAYKNFKKTIGTFDTLVTCRDYMNKIYQLTVSETDTTPLVSNSIVSDIRDDINRAITICTFDGTGMKYVDKSLTTTESRTVTGTLTNGDTLANGTTTATIIFDEMTDKIDHFDLVLYPFTTVYGLNTKDEHDRSFKNAMITDSEVINNITTALQDYKTISHKINTPDTTSSTDEIMCIKNYLRLNAKISTATKVNAVEWQAILSNIKEALYETFNCRELDFGEEIPFDDILETIQDADTNIKNVSLEDPDLYTSFMLADNTEYLFETATTEGEQISNDDIKAKFTSNELLNYKAMNSADQKNFLASKRSKAKELYNRLAIRNILAGRVELFNYNTDFSSTIAEQKNENYSLIYPEDTTTYITKLEPRFSIFSQTADTAKEIELGEHEIVQFRAPNFSTETSYPAYVNYFIKLENETTSYAIPATFQTLYTFVNTAKTINGDSYPSYVLNTFMNKMGNSQYMTTITESASYDSLVQTYGTVFTQIQLYPVASSGNLATDLTASNLYFIPSITANGASLNTSNYNGKVFKLNGNGSTTIEITEACTEDGTTVAAQTATIDGTTITVNETDYYSQIYSTSNTNSLSSAYCVYAYLPATGFSTDTTYYIYPLSSTTYAVWYNFIQQWTEFEGTDYAVTLSGIYKNLGGDQSRIVGSMVDEYKNKYQLATVWVSSTLPLYNYYVQIIHLTEKASTESTWGWTKNGFGKDAVYSSLVADSEYELKTGEFLCINYTESTSTTSEITAESDTSTIETTSTVINTYYGPGTIIRPNFALIDSLTKRNSSSYSKTSGYDFSSDLGSNYTDTVPGMFSLGTDEQIDIRKQVSVYVYDSLNTSDSSTRYIYVYFNTNDEDLTFLENGESRILEEGEYFWYTDHNKSTLTYCGSGTEVYNYTGSAIKKSSSSADIDTEDILEGGISVVPWIRLTGLFIKDKENPDPTSDRYIRWDEYQYINLITDDTLKTIGKSTDNDAAYIAMNITSTWEDCDYATYTSEDADSSLPEFGIDGITWQVRSSLELAVSSDYSQILISDEGYTQETLTVTFSNTETETESSTVLEDTVVLENVSIKSNYVISSTSDEIDTTYNLYDSDNQLVETVTDFKLKVFNDVDLYLGEDTADQIILNLNNMSNYYTTFSFDDPAPEDTNSPYITFYSAMANSDTTSHNFNLLMVYYQTATDSDNISDYVRLRVTLEDGNEAPIGCCTIYNNNDSWWDGLTTTESGITYYALKSGINIIKFYGDSTTADNLTISVYPGTDTTDSLVLGQLDNIVETIEGDDTDLGINLTGLGYQNISSTDGTTPNKDTSTALLEAINDLDPDHEFYYNPILDSSLGIDINELAGETLSTETMWYDYNNVNNKFVISEIDTDYIDTGISLTRSSSK